MKIAKTVNSPLSFPALSRASNVGTLVQPMILFVGPLPLWLLPLVFVIYIFATLGPLALLWRGDAEGSKSERILAGVSVVALLGSSTDWCGGLITCASLILATVMLGVDIASIVRRRVNGSRPN